MSRGFKLEMENPKPATWKDSPSAWYPTVIGPEGKKQWPVINPKMPGHIIFCWKDPETGISYDRPLNTFTDEEIASANYLSHLPMAGDGGRPPSPAETPKGSPGKGEVKVGPEGILSVQQTSGDKYVVRTQIKDAEPGIYKQSLMTKEEVLARGGEIPTKEAGVWGQGAGEKWTGKDNLTEQEIERREKAKKEEKPEPEIPLAQVARDKMQGEPEYIKKADFEALKREDSSMADLLYRKGFSALNAAIAESNRIRQAEYKLQAKEYAQKEQDFESWLRDFDPDLYKTYKIEGDKAYNTALNQKYVTLHDNSLMLRDKFNKLSETDNQLAQIALLKGGKALQDEYDKIESDNQHNYVTIGDQMMKKSDWDQLDKKYQAIASKSGWQAMDDVIKSDIADYNQAVVDLAPYIRGGEPIIGATETKMTDKMTEAKTLNTLTLNTLLPFGNQYYDITGYLKDHPGKEDTLKAVGFKEEAIKQATYYSKLNPAQLVWQSATPWNEYAGEKATPKGVAIMAGEQLVPGVYSARHWNEMTPSERVFSVAIDAFTVAAIVIPGAEVAGAGARGVGYASRAARFAAAAKALGGFGARQLVPVDMIVHPVSTARMTARGVRNFTELLVHPGRISEPVITTARGQVLFRASEFADKATAAKASDALMERLANGEGLYIKMGDYNVELRQSPLMKLSGAGGTHATPDLTAFENGLVVKLKEGQPVKEQGLFIANEPVVQYTEHTASGMGAIPIPTEAGGKAEAVFKYKPEDIARMDADPIRHVNFADAKNMPKDLAPEFERIVKKYDGKISGSFDTYLKVPGAKRPNDIDAVFKTPDIARQAQSEMIQAARLHGFEAVPGTTKRDVLINGKSVIDCDAIDHHDAMIPKEYIQPTNKIEGINFETLGEQYIRQSTGAVSGSKIPKRIQSVNKMAPVMLKELKEDGAMVRKPGIVIFTRETAQAGIPTDKLFYVKNPKELGWVKEAESKILPNGTTGEIGQKLWFRTGSHSIRTELWLEKPLNLSKADIASLKAAHILENIKAPFKTAVKVSGSEAGRVTTSTASRMTVVPALVFTRSGLNRIQIKILNRVLLKDGYITDEQARNLIRAERVTRAAATPVLTRIPTTLKRRNEVTLVRARPERAINLKRLESYREVVREIKGTRAATGRVTHAEVRQTLEAIRREPARTPPTRAAIRKPMTRIPPIRTLVTRLPTTRITPIREPSTRMPPARTPPVREPPPRQLPPHEPRPQPLRRGETNRAPVLRTSKGNTVLKDWTRKEVASAIAWRDGFAVHAIKSPYRRGIDEKSFNVDHLPEGLIVMKNYKGAGSQERSAKVTGRFPKKLTVDVGNQDVVITKGKGGRVKLQHFRDTRRSSNMTTISKGRNLSYKRGRIFHTRAAGGEILSRRPFRGY